jgi:hypothetical protein
MDVTHGQGELLSLQIDPAYPYADKWTHPQGDKLSVVYFDTEGGISETTTPNYSDSEVVGRAEPFKTFSGTGSKEIAITFNFKAQGERSIKDEVIYPARFLDALKYPMSGSRISYPPPPCLLTIGSLFMARVVITAADITWEAPFEVDTLLPHGASVPVTFAVVRNSGNLDYNFDGIFH